MSRFKNHLKKCHHEFIQKFTVKISSHSSVKYQIIFLKMYWTNVGNEKTGYDYLYLFKYRLIFIFLVNLVQNIVPSIFWHFCIHIFYTKMLFIYITFIMIWVFRSSSFRKTVFDMQKCYLACPYWAMCWKQHCPQYLTNISALHFKLNFMAIGCS